MAAIAADPSSRYCRPLFSESGLTFSHLHLPPRDAANSDFMHAHLFAASRLPSCDKPVMSRQVSQRLSSLPRPRPNAPPNQPALAPTPTMHNAVVLPVIAVRDAGGVKVDVVRLQVCIAQCCRFCRHPGS